jgi:hypothetical protein
VTNTANLNGTIELRLHYKIISTTAQVWEYRNMNASYDPGSGTEGQQTATLKKRWFRVKITLTGTDPAVSCWALGFLEMRES